MTVRRQRATNQDACKWLPKPASGCFFAVVHAASTPTTLLYLPALHTFVIKDVRKRTPTPTPTPTHPHPQHADTHTHTHTPTSTTRTHTHARTHAHTHTTPLSLLPWCWQAMYCWLTWSWRTATLMPMVQHSRARSRRCLATVQAMAQAVTLPPAQQGNMLFSMQATTVSAAVTLQHRQGSRRGREGGAMTARCV